MRRRRNRLEVKYFVSALSKVLFLNFKYLHAILLKTTCSKHAGKRRTTKTYNVTNVNTLTFHANDDDSACLRALQTRITHLTESSC